VEAGAVTKGGGWHEVRDVAVGAVRVLLPVTAVELGGHVSMALSAAGRTAVLTRHRG
jgi:hypothetical protein